MTDNMSPWVKRALEGTLPASDRTGQVRLVPAPNHWPHDQDGEFRCCDVVLLPEALDAYQREVRESDDATRFYED